MPSFQQDLVDALVDRLKTIKVVNGYNVDVPDSNIFVWLPLELQAARLPSLNLRDNSAEWEDVSESLYRRVVSFDVVGMVSQGKTSAEEQRRLTSDLVVALYNDGDRSFGGICSECVIVESETLVAQADATVSGIRLSFEATYDHCKRSDVR